MNKRIVYQQVQLLLFAIIEKWRTQSYLRWRKRHLAHLANCIAASFTLPKLAKSSGRKIASLPVASFKSRIARSARSLLRHPIYTLALCANKAWKSRHSRTRMQRKTHFGYFLSDARISSGDDGDLAWEIRHVFSSPCCAWKEESLLEGWHKINGTEISQEAHRCLGCDRNILRMQSFSRGRQCSDSVPR